MEETFPVVMSLKFYYNIRITGSEFGANNMKVRNHLGMYQWFWFAGSDSGRVMA